MMREVPAWPFAMRKIMSKISIRTCCMITGTQRVGGAKLPGLSYPTCIKFLQRMVENA